MLLNGIMSFQLPHSTFVSFLIWNFYDIVIYDVPNNLSSIFIRQVSEKDHVQPKWILPDNCLNWKLQDSYKNIIILIYDLKRAIEWGQHTGY